jgi:hypothetical protein
MFNSFNIMYKEMAQLKKRIKAFNYRHVRQPQSISMPYSMPLPDDDDDKFINIEEYSAHVTEQADDITNPTIDLAAAINQEPIANSTAIDSS